MLGIKDLKRRRNEWLSDNGRFVLLDASDAIHCISPLYVDGSPGRWTVGWVFIDNPWGLPHVASTTYESPVAAQAWVDASFCDHFGWFEAQP